MGARGERAIGPLLAAAVLLAASTAGAGETRARWSGFEADIAAPGADRGVLAATLSRDDEPLASLFSRHRKAARPDSAVVYSPPALGAERVQVVLRSLTVPGWGQATLGHPTAARVFAVVELSIWASFTSFRIQEALRRETTVRTAQLFATIDLSHRDEEFRRIVGSYSSSEEYNRLVVYRDAANIYLNDPDHPDYDGYHAYIVAHSLHGPDTWSWSSEEDQRRYRSERKLEQRAGLRANAALGLALVNRLLSMLDVARRHGTSGPRGHSINLEIAPPPGSDPTAMRFGVRARF